MGDDKDLYDVTLACENDQIQTLKVSLESLHQTEPEMHQLNLCHNIFFQPPKRHPRESQKPPFYISKNFLSISDNIYSKTLDLNIYDRGGFE